MAPVFGGKFCKLAESTNREPLRNHVQLHHFSINPHRTPPAFSSHLLPHISRGAAVASRLRSSLSRMVRKTKPFHSKEKLEAPRTVNSSPSARNLPKNDLGAVIFGTKNHTLEECLNKQLFGLPAPHYSYVKNITPGLPLFLFNYTNRKLHGVFEAVTSGQMFIDSKAWTESEGTVQTQYPAQVRVKTLRRCPQLSEEKFRPAISRNYYTENFFWFELDKQQTKRLIELFSPSPLPQKVTPPPPPPPPPNDYLEEKKHGFGMQKTWSDVVKKSSSSMKGKNGIVVESDPAFASSSFETNLLTKKTPAEDKTVQYLRGR